MGALCPCRTPGTQGTHTTVTHMQEKVRGKEEGLQQANAALWPLGNTADLGSSDVFGTFCFSGSDRYLDCFMEQRVYRLPTCSNKITF